ncbi:hypothetical protein BB560_000161 [Smittium megazygosporum]|uniref:Splicing factor subunit n=1 Tax=Smittium megazygosporum TaxID=133381 RepID=A0A2T9ZL65_9FUNG|nr:hypothetical protein BB560_000161 [Smittium megazygosporum]
MDKFGMNNQTDHMFAKYVGTGNPDTTKHEWLVNQMRDTYAYIIGNSSLNTYVAISEGESRARVKFNCLEKMLFPAGPPPDSNIED